MRSTRLVTAMLVTGVLLVGACGDDDSEESIPMTGNRPTTSAAEEPTTTDPAAEGVFPTTVQAANGPVTIEAQPENIVSLSPTATEMLFAIEAGEQVAAADEQSDFPAEAPDEEGLSGFEPNVEAISELTPDLVVVEGTTAVAELAQLDVPVLQLPAATTLEDSYNQINQLGQATGHMVKAGEVVQKMQDDIAAIEADVPQPSRGIKVFHEVDDTLYTVTNQTFLGQIYEKAGLVNVAADLPGEYVQISAEQVITANPDWVFLAYGDQDTIAEVKDRPGWDQIVAVQDDQVVTLDPDLASRWGPRTVELFQTIVDIVY